MGDLMSKIELNKPVFDATVSQLQDANRELSTPKFDPNINKTTLKSIKEQLDTFKELDRVLQEYQDLLELDTLTLIDTGNKLVERDTQIASFAKKL
mgnify:FL=1